MPFHYYIHCYIDYCHYYYIIVITPLPYLLRRHCHWYMIHYRVFPSSLLRRHDYIARHCRGIHMPAAMPLIAAWLLRLAYAIFDYCHCHWCHYGYCCHITSSPPRFRHITRHCHYAAGHYAITPLSHWCLLPHTGCHCHAAAIHYTLPCFCHCHMLRYAIDADDIDVLRHFRWYADYYHYQLDAAVAGIVAMIHRRLHTRLRHWLRQLAAAFAAISAIDATILLWCLELLRHILMRDIYAIYYAIMPRVSGYAMRCRKMMKVEHWEGYGHYYIDTLHIVTRHTLRWLLMLRLAPHAIYDIIPIIATPATRADSETPLLFFHGATP